MTIAEIRRSSGLTQEQLAAQLGVKQSYYSRVERGKGNPTFKIVTDMADAFHRPVGEVAEALADVLRSANAGADASAPPGYLSRLASLLSPAAAAA